MPFKKELGTIVKVTEMMRDITEKNPRDVLLFSQEGLKW